MQVRLTLNGYGNLHKRARTNDMLLTAYGTGHHSTVVIVDVMLLLILQEATHAMLARLRVLIVAVALIAPIDGIGAVHVEMTLADAVEQEPVEVIKLLRDGARLDVGVVEAHRLIPEEPCRAVTQIMACLTQQLSHLSIL